VLISLHPRTPLLIYSVIFVAIFLQDQAASSDPSPVTRNQFQLACSIHYVSTRHLSGVSRAILCLAVSEIVDKGDLKSAANFQLWTPLLIYSVFFVVVLLQADFGLKCRNFFWYKMFNIWGQNRHVIRVRQKKHCILGVCSAIMRKTAHNMRRLPNKSRVSEKLPQGIVRKWNLQAMHVMENIYILLRIVSTCCKFGILLTLRFRPQIEQVVLHVNLRSKSACNKSATKKTLYISCLFCYSAKNRPQYAALAKWKSDVRKVTTRNRAQMKLQAMHVMEKIYSTVNSQ